MNLKKLLKLNLDILKYNLSVLLFRRYEPILFLSVKIAEKAIRFYEKKRKQLQSDLDSIIKRGGR